MLITYRLCTVVYEILPSFIVTCPRCRTYQLGVSHPRQLRKFVSSLVSSRRDFFQCPCSLVLMNANHWISFTQMRAREIGHMQSTWNSRCTSFVSTTNESADSLTMAECSSVFSISGSIVIPPVSAFLPAAFLAAASFRYAPTFWPSTSCGCELRALRAVLCWHPTPHPNSWTKASMLILKKILKSGNTLPRNFWNIFSWRFSFGQQWPKHI